MQNEPYNRVKLKRLIQDLPIIGDSILGHEILMYHSNLCHLGTKGQALMWLYTK